MKKILELQCDYSKGVLEEIEAQDPRENMHWRYADAPDAETYYSSSVAPFQYESLRRLLPEGAKILDVGVGLGQSSIFLASKGYEVTSLEPMPRFCEIISTVAEKYGLNISVVRGVGESIASIGVVYDAIIFNSSLHHCDDPALALQQAFASLKSGGQVFLVNENYLKPWCSEREFQRRLISDPVGMGHYGGNEHSYHNWKYLQLLKSSFNNGTVLVPRALSALDAIEYAITIRIDGKRVYKSNISIAARFAFYLLRERLHKTPKIYKALAHASILPATFYAAKE